MPQIDILQLMDNHCYPDVLKRTYRWTSTKDLSVSEIACREFINAFVCKTSFRQQDYQDCLNTSRIQIVGQAGDNCISSMSVVLGTNEVRDRKQRRRTEEDQSKNKNRGSSGKGWGEAKGERSRILHVSPHVCEGKAT